MSVTTFFRQRSGFLTRVLGVFGIATALAMVPTTGAALGGASFGASSGAEGAPSVRRFPDVWIYPGDGSTVNSSPITVYVDACDWSGGGISSIDLYVNGSYYGTEWNWYGGCLTMSRTVYLANGWNSISATACGWECNSATAYVNYEYIPPPPPPGPNITINSPGDGSTLYGSPISFDVQACDNTYYVTEIYLYVNGSYIGSSPGEWWCAYAYGYASLSPGWNTLTASACNTWGSCSTSSVSVYFVPPAPSISFSPGNGTTVYSTPYGVSTSACSSWDASYVYLYVNGSHVNTGYGGNGTGCASTWASASLSAGWNTISAYSCNAWGNCSSTAVSIYYRPPAPSISFSPGSGTTVYSSPSGVSTQACSPYGVQYVELYVNGTYLSSGWGAGSGNECVSTSANASLSAGWNTVTGASCNGYGNCTNTSVSIYYQPPPPTVTYTPGNGGSVYTNPSSVSVQACSPWGISYINLYVNGSYISTTYGSGAGCRTATASVSLAAGANTISAYACNPYSCSSTSSTLSYIPPAPSISFSPNGGSVFTSPVSVSTTACSDPWGVSVLYLYVNNAHVGTASGGVCATATATAHFWVGNNTVSAYACNQYGNCRSSSVTVYRVPPPPSFSFSHGEGQTVSAANPHTISVEACSGYGGISTVYLYLNGTQVAVGYAGGTEIGSTAECVSASASVNLATGWNSVSAYACNPHQCASPAVNVYYPPPVYSVSVAASGPASTSPGYPNGAAAFRVIHNGARTGPMRIDFAAACGGVANNPCTSVSPAFIPGAYPGDEYIVVVGFGVNPVGTSGTVTLSATPAGGSTQSATSTVSPTPVYSVAVTPQSGTATVQRGPRTQVAFTITNNSINAAEPVRFNASVITCGAPLVNCAVSTPIDVARGSPATLNVAFDPTGGGTQGTIQLRVSPQADPSVASVGTFTVDVFSVLDAEVRTVNAGTALDRGECLTIAAGDGAAYECGALRLAHALPTTRTMNRARTPSLVYNSQHAERTMLIAADVRYTGAATPTTVEATLRVPGRPDVVQLFPWSSGCQGQTCRLTVRFDHPLNTHLYEYSVQTRVLSGSTVLASSVPATDTVVLINRRASPFGAGWWLAGLEELRSVSATKMLWIGGDGSTRLYTNRDASTWVVEPTVDRPDTLSFDGTFYRRHLMDGARVVFNTAGRHVQTVNKLGHVTTLGYTTVGGQTVLQTIQMPTPVGAPTRVYTFEYATTTGGAPVLRYVHAPDVDGAARTTTILHASASDNLVSSVRDVDNGEIAFGFASGARVGLRRNRRGDITRFGYDGDVFVRIEYDRTRTNPGAAPYVTTICPAEAQGLAACATGLRLAGQVRTKFDGPRTDVQDTTAFYLNRWGAPRQVVNALGNASTIEYGDVARFPMLATAVIKPNGFRTEAFFNARGLLDSTRAIDPLDRRCTDGSCNGVTKYTWHSKWALPTQFVSPTGERGTFDYDLTLPLRLWQEDGRGGASRYWFRYDADGLMRAIQRPGGATDSMAYDVQRNLARTFTPAGEQTQYVRDGIGRTVVTRQQIVRGNTALWQDDSTTYDLTDAVRRTVSYGPAHNGAPEQRIIVDRHPDAEGADTMLVRWSIPASRNMTMKWRFDALGRRIAEIAPDGAVEDTEYDEVGNVRFIRTRRNDPVSGQRLVVSMEYDALNRLRTRTTPQVSYAASTSGIPTRHEAVGGSSGENPAYPRFPNDGTGYTIAADVATFDYDVLDNPTVADNGDARIRREYFPSGLLKMETQQLRTLAGNDFSQHVYEIRHAYDLSGRRTELWHPIQLGPVVSAVTRYGYHPQTGSVQTVTDALGNVFTLNENMRGELESIARSGGITETFLYTPNGEIDTHRVANASTSPYRSLEPYLRNTRFEYDDARGKVTRTLDSHGAKDTLTATYSGLGHALTANLISHGKGHVPDFCWNANFRMVRNESFQYDAFANLTQSSNTTTIRDNCSGTFTTSTGQTHGYVNATGRLAWTQPFGGAQRDTNHYDAAGNSQFTTQAWYYLTAQADLQDRMVYYAADGKIRASDTRIVSDPHVAYGSFFATTFEEYRYDALGRRIWVRARRFCEFDPMQYHAECNLDKVMRTVWDGDDELYEIQMPGQDGSPYLENDVGQVVLPMDNTGSGYAVDPNPFYGRVAYTHIGGTDQPLSVIRMGYGDRVNEGNVDAGHRSLPAFAIFPLWSTRGQADLGVFADGGLRACVGSGSTARCVYNNWPGTWFAYARPTLRRSWWHGSVVEDKKDASGLHYRRNRQYDPSTGRFTQEDPIGLAGGMNLYGFAGGDPINHADPTGLVPVPLIILAIRAAPYVAAGAKLVIEMIDPNPNDAGSAIVKGGAKAVKQAHGAYQVMFESGKRYFGKGGGTDRAMSSAKRVATENNDKVKSVCFRQCANEREAFKEEARLLDRDGGPGSPTNYNKSKSPGTRMNEEDARKRQQQNP